MKKVLAILVFILGLSVVKAQPSSGGGTVNPTPFGFTEVLLLGGAVMGLKKGLDNNKKI